MRGEEWWSWREMGEDRERDMGDRQRQEGTRGRGQTKREEGPRGRAQTEKEREKNKSKETGSGQRLESRETESTHPQVRRQKSLT